MRLFMLLFLLLPTAALCWWVLDALRQGSVDTLFLHRHHAWKSEPGRYTLALLSATGLALLLAWTAVMLAQSVPLDEWVSAAGLLLAAASVWLRRRLTRLSVADVLRSDDLPAVLAPARDTTVARLTAWALASPPADGVSYRDSGGRERGALHDALQRALGAERPRLLLPPLVGLCGAGTAAVAVGLHGALWSGSGAFAVLTSVLTLHTALRTREFARELALELPALAGALSRAGPSDGAPDEVNGA